MKRSLLLCIQLLIPYSIFSQAINYETLTDDQYRKYFPLETKISMFTPTTDFICILPTNEPDKAMQSEINDFYRNSFINLLPMIPNQISRVIDDKQALKENLTGINIYAFGSVKGNLWISEFLDKAKDFPVKIFDDSIVADRVYKGRDYIVTSLWYNPYDFKHSVFLYIPQHQEYSKKFKFGDLPQFSIWQNGKKIKNSPYYVSRNNKWQFSGKRDTALNFRCFDSLYYNPFEPIGSSFCYRFPNFDQLRNCKINNNDVLIDTIRISEDYRTLNDMNWLQPIAKKYKVIAVGEGHHLKYNKYIFKRILFAINTYDYFPNCILELPYSYTGFFNYYLSLKNDQDANIYRDSVLSKIYEPGIPLIEAIRNWNKQNENKTIRVGFSDLEHHMEITIDKILNPYFRKLGTENIQNMNSISDLHTYIDETKQFLIQAKKQNLIGEFPFQTPEYMDKVFLNLVATINIKLDPKNKNNFTERYKVMIRNVTDHAFLGKYVSKEKSLFYGGFEHFRTLNDGSNQKATSTEGFYLAHSFEPTKGKVYSINMRTKAISIEDSIQRIDPRLDFRIETDRIGLYKNKEIKLNEPVLGFDFSEFDKYIYGLAYQYPGYAMRIQKIELNKLLNKYNGITRYMEYFLLKDLLDYNTNVIIPFSPVGDN